MGSVWQPQVPAEEVNGGPIEGGPDGVQGSENQANGEAAEGVQRKKIVIIGLGMVGISFMSVRRLT